MYLYGSIHWEFVLVGGLDFFGIKPDILNAVDKQLVEVSLLVCLEIGSDSCPLPNTNFSL